MKKVEAIIRPSKVSEIQDALNKYNIKGMTISHVLGFGKQKGHKEYYRGTVVEANLMQKVKIEIVCEDETLDEIVDIISKNARTGEVGDGKIFIYNIENAYRIRTGESGDAAI